MQIIPIRIFYEKKGRLKYISHLDTMTLFSRAIARAKLPAWYTEGFNPHIYITFALPISLGYEGLRESFEIKLVEELALDELRDRLNATLPPDMQVVAAVSPTLAANEIGWADYKIVAELPGQGALGEEKLHEYLEATEIMVDKKTKRGTSTVDIRPHIKLMEHSSDSDNLTFTLRLAAGNRFNVNPRLVWDSFTEQYGIKPESMAVTRTQIYAENEKIFE